MNIKVLDTTLRDGEQTPGVSLTTNEKFRIASKLDEIGIDYIEAGSAITSEGERKSIKEITSQNFNAEILSFSRPLTVDIDYCIDCDVDGVNLVVPTSDLHINDKLKSNRENLLELSNNAVDYCKDHGLVVELSAEDASRSDLDFLKTVYANGIEHGVDRICVCDTVGILTPDSSFELFNKLNDLNVSIACHCHNDFGFAVANSIAGLFEGASSISTTVNGIGERAGNASLEELIMALKLLYNKDLGFKTEVISDLSRIVSEYSKIPVPDSKAIVGNNVFRHESGIHVDAIVQDPFSYEPFLPELIGTKRQIVLGKHSGKSAIIEKLDSLNIKVDEKKLLEIVKLVKEEREQGFSITNEKFDEILLKANIKR